MYTYVAQNGPVMWVHRRHQIRGSDLVTPDLTPQIHGYPIMDRWDAAHAMYMQCTALHDSVFPPVIHYIEHKSIHM